MLSEQRLQLGVSCGSPESAADGQAAFGYRLAEGEDWAGVTRARADLFRRAIDGQPVARSHRAAASGGAPDLPIRPLSPGLGDRIWWGAGSPSTACGRAPRGTTRQLDLAAGRRRASVPCAAGRSGAALPGRLRGRRTHRAGAGRGDAERVPDHERRRPPVLRAGGRRRRRAGFLDGHNARSGPTFVGSPEAVADQLRADEAVTAADYVLFAIPSQLGVDYNAHLFENPRRRRP